jgi:uncharacterized RDD family membrane protein YckC
MSDAADLRFAAPEAQVADVRPDEFVLAGRGMRLVAVLIDALVLFGVAWLVLKIPALQPLAEVEAAGWTALNFNGMVVGFSVFLLVQAWLLIKRGQTVGKLLFRLRIERTDGSKAGAWRLLGLRYGIGYLTALNPALSVIYSLVDSLLIFRASHQCLHDSIADTRVIRL